MAEYSILVNYELCVGCYACEIACQQENELSEGIRWIRVVKEGPVRVNGKMYMNFLPMRCMHCGKPACMDACPTGAITKRSDGIVLIDEAQCTGCKLCVEICSFGALQFNPGKNVVEKCTLCVHRVDQGLLPYCVQHCPTRAMCFGDINEISHLKRNKSAADANRSLINSLQA